MKRLPAEWERQRETLLVFPHDESDWNEYLSDIRKTYIDIVKAITKYQKCTLLCKDIEEAKDWFAGFENINFIQMDTNDTWIRDYGPITIKAGSKAKYLDFFFNGWGLKYPANFDNLVNRKLYAEKFLDNLETIGFVLEGGSIESNGEGIILTTKECLLEANRNPHLSQKEIENSLKNFLGAKKILWLNHGFLAGDDTDSHIDTLARFIKKDTIVYVKCDDPEDEHFEELLKMEKELKSFKDLNKKSFTLVPLPWISPKFYKNERLPATYANFLFINDAILVPVYGDKNDKKAVELFKNLLPDREVIPVDSSVLIRQHGSIHCASMQIPML
ncbi:agmatine deiminase family protein [Nitrosophilus alvini]|uniref:agmatine deiminase family protein n=1 Tax=Nitrosophilus alvini TaxID=2714855 RepID=UPI001F4458DF|nr:agmatine deiminase family protein [Nitrosophilus alvini]